VIAHNLIVRSPGGNRLVEIDETVGRIVRVERHAEQAPLAGAVDRQGYKRRRKQLARVEIEHPDRSVLLNDKQPLGVLGSCSSKQCPAQARGHARGRNRVHVALRPIRIESVDQVIACGAAQIVDAIVAYDDIHARHRNLQRALPIARSANK